MNTKRFSKRASLFILCALAVTMLITHLFVVNVYADGAEDDTAAEAVADIAEADKSDEESEETSEEPEADFKAKTGIWATIAIPFGYVIRVCYKILPVYIVALLLFALVMKVILFPFGIKQQKNMMKQASLKPKEDAIRKKYAGRTDKVTQQKVQQEIMDLYQKENFNPAGGCLPMLIQLPLLFAVYQVVYNPLRYILGLGVDTIEKIAHTLQKAGYVITNANYGYDLYVVKAINEENFHLIKDIEGVSGKLDSIADLPKLSLFGIDLAIEPSNGHWLYLIIPIVTFGIVYLTSVLTKKLSYQSSAATGDSKTSGCIMDIVMPLMSAFFAYTFPAVIGIYWMFQNVLGVLQQLILKKMYPMPKFTKEDYEKAEKEILGKEKKKKKTVNQVNAKRHPNSLHHVDDEEDEVVEAKPVAKSSDTKESVQAEGPIVPAPLKEDRKDDGKEE